MFRKVINNNVKKKLEWANKIALFWHTNPDGDCIWSMLGLWKLLEKQWKKVHYFTPTWPSKVFYFLKWINKIKKTFFYDKYDLLVFLDFSWYPRIWEFTKWHEKYFNKNEIVVIDHHPWDEPNHWILIKDSHVMSTCELVYENTIKWWPKLFDSQIATYLYMWLTTDSWNFLYDVDHKRILTNALGLIELGAEKWLVINNLIRRKSLNTIKFTSLLLDRIKQKWNLLYSFYDDNELREYDIEQEQASYPLTIIQNIEWPKVVLVIRKIDNEIRWSLRSRDGVNCNLIAKKFGWWGHKAASWFTVDSVGSFEMQVEQITNEIKKMI